MAKVKTKTAEQWINTIKDKTVKQYLTDNHQNHPYVDRKEEYESFLDFLENDFHWTLTPQGFDFWEKIYDHFEKGSGYKTYEDFKEHDLSVKPEIGGNTN